MFTPAGLKKSNSDNVPLENVVPLVSVNTFEPLNQALKSFALYLIANLWVMVESEDVYIWSNWEAPPTMTLKLIWLSAMDQAGVYTLDLCL